MVDSRDRKDGVAKFSSLFFAFRRNGFRFTGLSRVKFHENKMYMYSLEVKDDLFSQY